jgi:hypothetical protein
MPRAPDREFAAVVDAQLPNGLHDGVLQQLKLSLADQALRLRFDADMSLPGSRDKLSHYAPFTLVVGGLWAFSCEHLDGFGRSKLSGQRMDCGRLEEAKLQSLGWPSLPDDVFACWLFLNDLNAFIYFAGRSVRVSSITE